MYILNHICEKRVTFRGWMWSARTVIRNLKVLIFFILLQNSCFKFNPQEMLSEKCCWMCKFVLKIVLNLHFLPQNNIFISKILFRAHFKNLWSCMYTLCKFEPFQHLHWKRKKTMADFQCWLFRNTLCGAISDKTCTCNIRNLNRRHDCHRIWGKFQLVIFVLTP